MNSLIKKKIGIIWTGFYRSFLDIDFKKTKNIFDSKIWINNELAKIKNKKNRSQIFKEDLLLNLVLSISFSEMNKISILDIGGSFGATYYKLDKNIQKKSAYYIYEKESIVSAGNKFFKNKSNIKFYNKLPKKKIDVIIIKSSIHYIEDWKDLLKKLDIYDFKMILIFDLPSTSIKTHVKKQKYYNYIQPVWFFNLKSFKRIIKKYNLKIILEKENENRYFYNFLKNERKNYSFSNLIIKKIDN